MLTSAQIKTLVFTGLTEPQQEAAAGYFSDPADLNYDEVAVCNNYFDEASNETIRKFTLSAANGILYFQGNAFKVLSSPKLVLTTSNCEVFVGHDGNRLFHPSPVSISAEEATAFVATQRHSRACHSSLGASR